MLLETALADFSAEDSPGLGQPGPASFSWEAMPAVAKSPAASGVRFGPVVAPPGMVPLASHPDVQVLRPSPSRQFSGELTRSGRPRLPYNVSKLSETPMSLSRSLSDVICAYRALSFGADEIRLQKKTSPLPEDGTSPFSREEPRGKPKSEAARVRSIGRRPLQPPPVRLTSVKDWHQAECSDSSSPGSIQSSGHSFSSKGVQGRSSDSLSPGSSFRYEQSGSSIKHQLKAHPGDVVRMSRIGSEQATNHHSRNDSSCSIDSEYKFYDEESPVSILECLPSPPLNSNALSRGSPLQAHPNSSASSSPATYSSAETSSQLSISSPTSSRGALRCLPSFHSASLHSSAPPASTSSSSNFMASCLVALEVALASNRDDGEVDPHESCLNSLRHPDVDDDSPSSRPYYESASRHRWSGNQSHLEPEYHTMDFYSDRADDRYRLSSGFTSGSSRSHSLGRSSPVSDGSSSPRSFVSSRSGLSRLTFRRPRGSRRSADEYTLQDRELLQLHRDSWVHQPDDSCSIVDSERSVQIGIGRHREVYWDDQQSDLASDRAEEVVRGAVDGLRFTYSPVSSAFVFTRPSDVSNGGEPEIPPVRCASPPNTVDTEISQRFSISLDYATSICSEDSLPYSMGRASDVTELGISRAESWSKVVRGAPADLPHQAGPSGLLERGVSYVVEEESGCDEAEYGGNHLADCTIPPRLPKRRSKKSGMATCLSFKFVVLQPFRSILRNVKAMSPGRSRLGPPCECGRQRQPNWNSQSGRIL